MRSEIGTFVTAKLKNEISPRQGWIVHLEPLKIIGQTGTVYECEGIPVEVDNPPKRTGKWEPTEEGEEEWK